MIIIQNNGHYITRLVTNNTNLEKICQYCGKPAEIKNNRQDPYLIQLICKSCRKEKGLNSKEKKDIMCDDIPLIDVRNYINNDIIKSKIINLTPEIIDKLNYLLNSDLTKKQALEYMNMSNSVFIKHVNKYTEDYDNLYASKLEKVFVDNRNNLITKNILKYKVDKNITNNLTTIKYERGLSNNDIIKLSDYTITNSTISNICTGKIQPTIKTKCKLAEVLNLSVADIFPEDWLFCNIKNYDDYLNINNDLREVFNTRHEFHRLFNDFKYINELSKLSSISSHRLYEFKNNRVNLNHDELVDLIDILANEMEDKYAARDFRASFI